MGFFDDNLQSIGRTPLVRLNRVSAGCCGTVLAKIEGRNPAYSVKCRVGVNMILDAEAKGILTPGSRSRCVLEPTSGNTGIALAFACASRGYPLMLTMPESMSLERRQMLKAYGAELVLTPAAKGMKGAIECAENMVAQEPSRFWMPQQFKNPANPAIHELTTGPEIWEDTDGGLDALICGVGTGGTITGCGRFLRRQQRDIRLVAVEPLESAVLTAIRAGETPAPSPHKIQGIGAGFKPEVLDMDLVDAIEIVNGEEAIAMAKRMHREEGITCGISSGAAVVAAVRLASMAEMTGKLLVVVLPDSGERYLSTDLFRD